MIYSLVHLIALVLPAQCWVNLGVGWQCQGVGHWAAVNVIFTGGAFSHLRDCSLNCTQGSTFICSNSRLNSFRLIIFTIKSYIRLEQDESTQRCQPIHPSIQLDVIFKDVSPSIHPSNMMSSSTPSSICETLRDKQASGQVARSLLSNRRGLFSASWKRGAGGCKW